jgi:hypothetical protein
MENSESEKMHIIETVTIGDKFKPFDPDYVTIEDHIRFPSFSRYIDLYSPDELPKSRFLIYASNIWHDNTQVITPFNPDEGYQIDSNDFSIELRKEKLSKLKAKDTPSSPLVLGIQYCPNKTFNLLSVPDYEAVFKSLRVLIDFQNGIKLEGKHDKFILQGGELSFSEEFYPTDTGELSVDKTLEDMGLMTRGLQIALPSDLELLSTIDGKFILTK